MCIFEVVSVLLVGSVLVLLIIFVVVYLGIFGVGLYYLVKLFCIGLVMVL